MKIALFNEKYHPNVSGGTEKSVKVLADALRVRGVTPEVITLSPETETRVDSVDGVRVHYLASRNFFWPFDGKRRARWRMWAYHARDAANVAMVADAMRALDGIRPDLAHTNNLSGLGIPLWRALGARSLPIVHTLRDYFLMYPFSTRFRAGRECEKPCLECAPFAVLGRRLSRRVDAVVGNSRDILDSHLAAGYFPDTPVRSVVYNASTIRADDLRPAPPPSGRRGVTFAYLGRITPEKGVERLLNATRRLPDDGWRLLMAGDGKNAYVASLRQRFGSPNVVWSGWVDAADVYRRADWVLVPSLWRDPLPRVILEAHSLGIPVIASSKGGNPEVVSHRRTGLIFDPDTHGALPALLAEIVSGTHSPEAFHPACLAAGDAYRPERLADDYIAVYERLIGSRRDRAAVAGARQAMRRRSRFRWTGRRRPKRNPS